MADVIMPESVPCQFDKAWQGKCAKPSTNGWCSEHENLTCLSCSEKAVKSCDNTSSLVCGASLCEACVHGKGDVHITRKAANEIRVVEEAEEQAKMISRTSTTQRMNEALDVPLNLFEFKKGNRKGSEIKEFFLLELEHTLMGFFPALFVGTERMVITTDFSLICRVWRMMKPRKSKINRNIGHVILEKNLVYPILGDSQYYLEESKPLPLLTDIEFDCLIEDGKISFEWALGLIGGGTLSPQQFEDMIEREVEKYQMVEANTK